MTQDCRQFLEDYIANHIYGKTHDYDFYRLFKLYSAYEITCPADTKRAVDEFYDFLLTFKHVIFKNTQDIPKLVKYSTAALHTLFGTPLTPLQKGFISLVKDLAPKGKDTSILDVGAGMYPKGSIELAKTFKNVTAIDKQFILSLSSMDHMNIKAVEKPFDIISQIQDYDFIIGRRPCSAIEPMVKLAAKEKKPYFIELCNCALPANPDPSVNKNWSWKNILPNYDPDIQFTSAYAYNLGSRNNTAKKFIEEKMPAEIFEKNFNNCKPRKEKALSHEMSF